MRLKGHSLLALHLNDPSISAHQIRARGYDVLVYSYEFAEANYRRKCYPRVAYAWRLGRNTTEEAYRSYCH